MAKIAFSDVGLRSIKPPDRGQCSYWDEKFPAFGIRVSQGGSKTFVLNRHNSLITIGRFGVLGLSEARTEAKKLLAEYTLGKIRPQSITFPQAVALFIADKKKQRRERTAKDYERLLGLFPFKGQLGDVSFAEVSRQLAKITAPSEFNHALVALKVFYNWCMKRRYITANPTVGLSTQSTTSRDRVLSDAEVKLIWQACEQSAVPRVQQHTATSEGAASTLPANFVTIVKLLILTGQRRTEIASLQTSWIKENQITLPKEITKNGREHTFPIGQLACTALNLSSTKTGYLFPARGVRDRAFNGWSKSKAALDKLSGVTDWTLHDLRRTFATTLAKLRTPIHVTEKLLNHISGSHSGIVGVYQRHQYEAECREAVEKYQAHLLQLLAR